LIVARVALVVGLGETLPEAR